MSPERRRLLAVAGFLLLAIAVAVPFATTYGGHLTEFAIIGSDVAATDVSVQNGTLSFSLRMENPATRPVEVVGAFLIASAGGEQYSEVTGTEAEELTIEPGATASIEVRVNLLDGYADRTRDALAAGELSVNGVLNVDIGDYRVSRDVRLDGVGDG
ncbi:MAG: hypothetical protein ABEH90_09345 [Halolamina sp.]